MVSHAASSDQSLDDYYTKTKPITSHTEQAGGRSCDHDDDDDIDYEGVMSRVDWVIFARQVYY